MENIFIKLLSMSISASWIIIIAILLRLVWKRIPRNIYCILWILVAVRLTCPISIESPWSLIPDTQPTYSSIADFQKTAIGKKSTEKDQPVAIEFVLKSSTTEITETQFMQRCISKAAEIWIIGLLLFIIHTIASFFKINKKTKESIVLHDNILLCDHIETPFIWGLFRPKIILPSSIDKKHLTHVLAHEKAHLSRHDYWWKPFGFILLAIYWFNPLIWVAYKLLCRDIELACDEKVIKNYDNTCKKEYSLTLLDYSTKPSKIPASPLAFGEIGVKERIKVIMKYKKPAYSIICIAAIVCIIVAICFLTDPQKTTSNNNSQQSELTDNRPLKEGRTESKQKSLSDASTNNFAGAKQDKPAKIWGFITNMEEKSVTIDRQNWVTEEDDNWKPEYDIDIGFKVVDVDGEDITFQLNPDCTYHILKNHHDPVVELGYREFKKNLKTTEYPVLWIFTIQNHKITSIHEQYRP